MRVFVPLLAIVLVACRAAEVREDQTAATYAKGQLVGPLEKFKDVLRKGDAKLGLPQLDPYTGKHLDVNMKSEGLFLIQGALDNVRESGLANYKVLQGDFTLVGLKVNVSLLWDQINVMTKYDLKGLLGSNVEFYGKGTIAAVLKGLQVSIDVKLSVKDEHLYIAQMVLHLHMKKLDFKVSGMYNDPEMSDVVSQIVSELAPGVLDDYQDRLMNYLTPILQNKANSILKNFTMKDLMDIIKG
ncbi:uncharacterized protein LOC143427473 [Xylocopa sonorina]|uniref:uncharacterized protein LOC143427473 n=1 Tax=Xylocopa sonorina TaxID=1818115 RepID=UPI00403A9013